MTNNIKCLHGVYSVVPDDGGQDIWVEIGFAIPHADGCGFDLTLRALPLDSKLIMRQRANEPAKMVPSLARQVRDFERTAIKQCLLETGGDVGAALKRLKIPRRTLSAKMARLGINRRRLRDALRERAAAVMHDPYKARRG